MAGKQNGRVADKVAIVTGAASGIGEATAICLAEQGAAISVVDIDEAGGRRAVKKIEKAGGRALFIKADVGKAAHARRMVDQTTRKFGRLDIIHNNAIWYKVAPATKLEEKDWDRTIAVGLKAVYLSAKYGIPAMLRTGGGSIVNTSSVHALASFPEHTAYDSAKAGILGLTRTLAIDYGPKIRVNAVLPGAILTPLWTRARVPAKARKQFADLVPAKRLGTSEDVAHAVLYLVSDEASFVTGTSLVVDGGMLCRTM